MSKKTYLLSLILLICLTSNSFSQTQAEMNRTAIDDYKKTEAKLNTVYNQLLKSLSNKERKLLITAQKNWITFRDSHCAFEAEEFEGGSLQSLIYITCKEECTTKRIEDLNASIDRKK